MVKTFEIALALQVFAFFTIECFQMIEKGLKLGFFKDDSNALIFNNLTL